MIVATGDGLLHGTAVGHNENGPDNHSPWLNLAAAIVKQAVFYESCGESLRESDRSEG